MKKFIPLFLAYSIPIFGQDSDLPPPPPAQGFSQMLTLFSLALIFFYFILWRPEQKRRKAQDDIRSKMKKGDKVNALGIIGTVAKVNDNTVILRMVDGSKIEVVKAAITEVTPGTDDEIAKTDAE